MRRRGRNDHGGRFAAVLLVAAGLLAAAVFVIVSDGGSEPASERERPPQAERGEGGEVGRDAPDRREAADAREPTRESGEGADEAKRGAAPDAPPTRRQPPPRVLEPLPGFEPRYTVRRPGGWDPQEPAILTDRGELLLERLLDGGLSAYIGVVRSERAEVPLRSYATGVLGELREAGLGVRRVGPIRRLKVAGESALATGFTVRDQTKRGRERQVVFYRGGQVFFVTLNVQDARAYAALEPAFRRFLSSWRWQR